MTGPELTTNLTEPLSEHSHLVRRADVQVGLLDDRILLVQPLGPLACLLDASAAGLWLSCDGRPFAGTLELATRTTGGSAREIMDLFRMLRLLGMVEDAPDIGSTGEVAQETAGAPVLPPLSTPFPRIGEFRFRGLCVVTEGSRLAIIGDGDECSLELGTPSSASQDQPTAVIRITGPAGTAQQQLQGLEAITALVGSAPETPIDVLIRLATDCTIVLTPDPAAEDR